VTSSLGLTLLIVAFGLAASLILYRDDDDDTGGW